MSQLQKHDLGIFPRYICSGRPAHEQVVLAYLWAYAIEGKSWTYAGLSGESGCSAPKVGKCVEALAKDGVLIELPETERADSKPSSQYIVNADFVPEHDAPEDKKKKQGPRIPPWAFEAVALWSKIHGSVQPHIMLANLEPVVQIHGKDATLRGLEKYAKYEAPKFASPKAFAARANHWIGTGGERLPEARSFADMT